MNDIKELIREQEQEKLTYIFDKGYVTGYEQALNDIIRLCDTINEEYIMKQKKKKLMNKLNNTYNKKIKSYMEE